MIVESCPTCKRRTVRRNNFGRIKNHRCPPSWHVLNYSGKLVGIAYGANASDASEWWREHDEDDWEMFDKVELSLRRIGEDGSWLHFEVHRERSCASSAPASTAWWVYSAFTLVDPPEGWTEPTAEALV